MTSCFLDNKRCYIHDPYVEGTYQRDKPMRCRHGEFWEKCPAQTKKKEKVGVIRGFSLSLCFCVCAKYKGTPQIFHIYWKVIIGLVPSCVRSIINNK